MNQHLVTFAVAGLLSAGSASGVVLFSDSFNHADSSNYDVVSQDSSQGGTLATTINTSSSRVVNEISGNQLLLNRNNLNSQARTRFHDQDSGGRFDFNSTLAGIGSSGSITVSFDWTPSPTTDWIGFSFGTDNDTSGEPTVRVNHATTDLGVLVKPGGDVEYFDNGPGVTLSGAHSETGPTLPISITVSYASLSNGGALTLESVLVGSTETISSPVSTFAWDFDDGTEIHLELESRASNNAGTSLIDNLSISAIPEPSTTILGALGFFALLRRRRA